MTPWPECIYQPRVPYRASVVLAAALILGILAAWAPLATALLALLALLFAPLIARVAHASPIHPFEPLWPFLVAFGVTFILKPLLLFIGRPTYPWTNMTEADAIEGVLWAAGALGFFYLGYFSDACLAFERWLPFRSPSDPPVWRLRIGAILLAAGGVAAVATLARMMGSVPTIQQVLDETFRARAFELIPGRGYLTFLLNLSAFAPAAQAYVALSTRRRLDILMAVLLGAASAAAAIVFYSRTLVLQLLITLTVVLHFKGGWFTPRTLLVLGSVFVTLGGALGLHRVGISSLAAAITSPLFAISFLGHTFDSFEFLVPAVQRMSLLGEGGGVSLLEDLGWTYLPRALFPGKPSEYGYLRIQNLLMPDLRGITATFPPGFLVEWYVNFGVLGFVFIAIAYGVLFRCAGRRLFLGPQTAFSLLFYGGIVLNMAGWFRSSAQMMVSVAIYGGSLFLLFGRPALTAWQQR